MADGRGFSVFGQRIMSWLSVAVNYATIDWVCVIDGKVEIHPQILSLVFLDLLFGCVFFLWATWCHVKFISGSYNRVLIPKDVWFISNSHRKWQVFASNQKGRQEGLLLFDLQGFDSFWNTTVQQSYRKKSSIKRAELHQQLPQLTRKQYSHKMSVL